VIFVHQNLISNRLTYLVPAKSTGELISFAFSDRSVRSLISAKRSANCWDQTKNDFTFWLIFGLSPSLGLSKTLSGRLIKKWNEPMSHFTFWISLPLRLSLSPKFGLRPKISQKVKSFFVWSHRFRYFAQRIRWDQTSDWAVAQSKAN